MRFSVVVPARNAPNLSAAIDSCLTQRPKPHEVIVVDDASSEHPVESLRERFAAECDRGLLKIITLSTNRGPSAARNTGWDAATGDFVAFLDADDRWNAGKLAVVASWLTDNQTIDWLAHGYAVGPTEPENDEPAPARLSLRRLLVSNPGQTSSVVLRGSISQRFDEGMRHSEDYDLWLRIAAAGHGCYFSPARLTALGRPQLAAGGLSENRRAMRKGEMRAFLHLIAARPILAPLLPFLLAWSLLKHFRKAVS
ncbi:MAG: glycosyltransferase family A protein [Gemmatimonadetes bacterium]|nr:glycosyltransferase family A protein [Gemmatimonadota bacterium]